MKWKSNARSNQDNKDGSIFNLKEVDIKISIHKYVGSGNDLYLTCGELGFSQEPLKTDNFDVAVDITKQKIIQRMRHLESECKKFLNDESENEFMRY